MNTIKHVKSIYKEIIQHRRKIHRHPELSFQEYKTSEYISSVLTKLKIEHKSIGGTGIVGLIGKGKKCVGLRADIDALPIQEKTELPFASKNPGIMHACGHDMHTAMLLGAAKILKQKEKTLKGTVKLIFQPGEEKLPGGASLLIKEGVLKNPRPKAIFGQHIFPEDETGTISVAPKYVMASADELYWTITAEGGHAAQPHSSSDGILASSHLVIHLQSFMTKFKNPISPGVLSITAFNGGTAPNIFPNEVKLMGTLRTFDNIWRLYIHDELKRHSKKICELHNTKCELSIVKGYPPLYNDIETTEFIIRRANELLGENNVKYFEHRMWAEDFAYYSLKIPSTFWFLGVKPKDVDFLPSLHNEKLNPDEEAMIYGTAMFVDAAIQYLDK
jgi:amidohydrolase